MQNNAPSNYDITNGHLRDLLNEINFTGTGSNQDRYSERSDVVRTSPQRDESGDAASLGRHRNSPGASGRLDSRSQPTSTPRTTSLGADVPDDETVAPAAQFDLPIRSIFASGPPTSSVSINTAQASLSAAAGGSSGTPMAALSNASSARRSGPRPLDIDHTLASTAQSTEYTIPGTHKDVDDPSTNLSPFATSGIPTTSQALANLFSAPGGPTPGSLSRHTTQGRARSNSQQAGNDTSTLHGHLLHLGFMEGRHSDITVHAFGDDYKLHKLLLERIPFFSTAFCGAWAESSANEMTLMPEEIDPNITQKAFELALKRIYGTVVPFEEEQECIGLFATGCWLDMPDVVNTCIENILRQMRPATLHVLIQLVTINCYGKPGERILSSAKAMLYRDGWEMPFDFWDDIPAEIVQEVVGGDPFYVPGEWERWYLALKLLNRRLRRFAISGGLVSSDGCFIKPRPTAIRHAIRFTENEKISALDSWRMLYAHSEIIPLLELLDTGIHYVHLRFEQLQQMKLQKDILGVPVLPDRVISDALWMSMELRQRILNAQEGDLELGLSESADTVDDVDDNVTINLAAPSAKGKRRESEDRAMSASPAPPPVPTIAPPRRFWIPNQDVSCVLGGSSEAFTASPFAASPDVASRSQRLSANFEAADVAWPPDLGGSIFDSHASPARQLLARAPPRFSTYPPFRFCAEFPNPRTLKEKKRVYSQTVWYAGSMWNLYIQRVNTSKNQQLGIYLHRAKDKDPSDDPLAMTVDDRIGHLEREMLLRSKTQSSPRSGRFDHVDLLDRLGSDHDSTSSRVHKSSQSRPSIAPMAHRLTTSASSANPSAMASAVTLKAASSSAEDANSQAAPEADSIPLADTDSDLLYLHSLAQVHTQPTIPPYTDARSTIKTYFKIYSPSKAGRLLSVYESAPDSFNFGKSWGWKSSQMVLDDGIHDYESPRPVSSSLGVHNITSSSAGGLTHGNKDGKLRYMVVIGNI